MRVSSSFFGALFTGSGSWEANLGNQDLTFKKEKASPVESTIQ